MIEKRYSALGAVRDFWQCGAMTRSISRRWFLSATSALLGTAACADAPERSIRPVKRDGAGVLRREVGGETLVRNSGLSGVVGYAVIDMRSGKVLEERAASASLPPASVTKAVTALYALDALGQDHRFATRVIATGGVQDGVVLGDLVLAGGGDPTLDTDQLAALAQRVKQAGIREVRGEFRVWGGALPFSRVIDPGQPEHVGYNPAVSGLNLNFNRVHFEWRRASGQWRTTMDARSAKYRPDISMSRMTISTRSRPIYTYADGGSHDSWTVASGALGKGGARWLPVRKPELYAGEVFQSFARSQGIVLAAPVLARDAPGGQELARVQSVTLDEITRDMLRYSTNLTAEVLGLAATQARQGRVSSLQGSAQEMTLWARQRLGMGRGARFVDHSGLGDKSRLTAGDMAEALRAARGRAPIRALMKPIPMRNEARKVIQGHPVKVDAKTGTLNFVSALAGYASAEDGRELAFAIFSADTRARAAIPKAQRERPEGASRYNRAAKALQQKLLQRWGRVYGKS